MKSAARLALLLFAAAAMGCDSPRDQLDADALKAAARGLESLSAEAGLLTRQLGSQSVTTAFALVHEAALEEESLKLAKRLAKAVPPELQSAHQAALALNARLQTGLGQIGRAAQQPAQYAQLEQEFRRVQAAAHALEARP